MDKNVLDCLVEVTDAIHDVEEAPVVLLRPRHGLVGAREGGGRVCRGPDLRRRRSRGAGRGPCQPQRRRRPGQLLRVQRRTLQEHKKLTATLSPAIRYSGQATGAVASCHTAVVVVETSG